MPLWCGVWAIDIGKVMSFRPEEVVFGILQLIPTLAEMRVGRMDRVAVMIETAFIVTDVETDIVISWQSRQTMVC